MSQTVVAGKRVAIISGHFSPEIGYQEVDLARAFTRLGAHVRVVTSTRLSPNARTLVRRGYRAGFERVDGYEVVRLEPRLTIGPNVLGCDVRPPIVAFEPDFVIVVGPGKLFGVGLFTPNRSPWRRIAVMQDNSEDGRSRRTLGRGKLTHEIAHRLIKRPVYRRVTRYADRIVLNVPETHALIEQWLGPKERELLRLKELELRLGFDPERFFFDPAERQRWRSHHGVSEEEVVLATCTRAVPSKRLESVIEAVSALRSQGLRIRYALAGLLDDDYAESLRGHVQAQQDPGAFLLLPGLNQREMRDLFSGADIGFWPRAAITIQQAMGTGLPVLLPPRPTVSRLLSPEQNGWYLGADESLEHALARATESLSVHRDHRMAWREALAEHNRSYLSYAGIASAMIDGLD
jgi:glycosyltransferase involved in cell wall biosynthesis